MTPNFIRIRNNLSQNSLKSQKIQNSSKITNIKKHIQAVKFKQKKITKFNNINEEKLKSFVKKILQQ